MGVELGTSGSGIACRVLSNEEPRVQGRLSSAITLKP